MILLSMQKKLICIGVGEAGKYCRDAKQKDWWKLFMSRKWHTLPSQMNQTTFYKYNKYLR
jgi:hypothetical protein